MPAKTPKPQTRLTVLRTEALTPRLIRVWLGGPAFADFRPNTFTDMYVKLVFSPDGRVPEGPINVAQARAELPAGEAPVTRTYTVRTVDEGRGELAIDVVTHGDRGIAGVWAQRARPGDALLLQGPGGAYAPDPDADWHVLAGDESALPAIASAIEALPSHARGVAVIEVESEDDDALPLAHPAGVEVTWVARNGAGPDPMRLRGALEAALGGGWPSGVVHVFAHGERESVKALRTLFREREVPRERLSISGYWAHGRTEDAFQAEKREPIGKID
ncbi:siderophore-interacting protein [Falsarthrobacter nasiphocae]|uniref:NADPH-dependent ferric siderophore reductase n=1 Tax=Falsarthrobacter nasiphocae TaxID=189863 RepID=A0AAE3YGC1_9MICC|nr:siderophore-interacting protein [Falsarthrobacter nasiphocae]MDR6891506.1 NADPH-dependent ferric siderophore reductase [Falsarthrobacter nasiphocae]